MNPDELIKKIYYGDRACKSVLIDSWNNLIKIQLDCISRVIGNNWNYYNDENIYDGFLVFTFAEYISLTPNGLIPNDLINIIDVKKEGEDKYIVVIDIDNCDDNRDTSSVIIKIICSSAHIEDGQGNIISW